MKDLLLQILNASSEEDFVYAMNKVYNALKDNEELVSYMKTFDKNRHHFAVYAINATYGTLLQKGSSIAESNHSSYVARIGQASSDEIEVVCKCLLQRQVDINTAKHEDRAKYGMEARRESVRLSNDGDFEGSKAILKLSSWACKRWKQEYEESTHYQVTVNDDTNGATTVSRLGIDAPGRKFSPQGRCNCTARVSELIQCRHEICRHSGKFLEDFFDERWYRIDGVPQSYFLI
ncbi:MAG: hypothetical protein ACREOZ_01065, partial [Gloeomargaritales cyanobacterium]